MRQAEHVSDLMTGQQRDAVQHDLLFAELGIGIVERGEHVHRLLASAGRAEERVPVIARGAPAVRIELHDGVQDFAGARVHLAHADRPSAPVAVGPLDDRVAHVERVGVGGEVLDDDGVLESGEGEGIVPPENAALGGGTNVGRHSRVDIEGDRLDRLAQCGFRIFFHQAPARDEAALQRLVVGLREVLEIRPEEADANVLLARLEARLGQRDERMVLAHGERVRVGRVEAELSLVGSEGQHRLHFRVPREIPGVLQVDDAAVVVEPPHNGASLRAHDVAGDGARWIAQLSEQIEDVAHDERIAVHQQRAVGFRLDRKRSEYRGGKAQFNGFLQRGRTGSGAELVVLLDDEHALSDAEEAADGAAVGAAAVGKHVERADAAAQRGEVEEFVLECAGRKFEEQRALFRVPVIRSEAVGALESGGAGGDVHVTRGCAGAWRFGRWLLGEGADGKH